MSSSWAAGKPINDFAQPKARDIHIQSRAHILCSSIPSTTDKCLTFNKLRCIDPFFTWTAPLLPPETLYTHICDKVEKLLLKYTSGGLTSRPILPMGVGARLIRHGVLPAAGFGGVWVIAIPPNRDCISNEAPVHNTDYLNRLYMLTLRCNSIVKQLLVRLR